jgi:hypothetical protein
MLYQTTYTVLASPISFSSTFLSSRDWLDSQHDHAGEYILSARIEWQFGDEDENRGLFAGSDDDDDDDDVSIDDGRGGRAGLLQVDESMRK